MNVIQSCPFCGCSSLIQILFPDSLTNIGKDAFPENVKVKFIFLMIIIIFFSQVAK